MHTDRFFAPCPRGLEGVLAEELDTLGASAIETADGGVAFAGDFTVMMRANLHSRFASRILWRLGGGRCRTEAELYRAASGIDWPLLFNVERTIKVKTDAIRSPLSFLPSNNMEDAPFTPCSDDIHRRVETLQTVIPKATEKGLRYFYKPNPSLEQTDTERKLSPVYYADVDPDHFREITANLIENAIKYTLEGEVIVDVTGDDQTVTVSVRDSGIGIPTEDIPHLFQKFYRVDNTDTREIGGTGLGLYLSRRLAEAMSGNLRVESEYKKGSTFFLDIPRMSHEGALEKMRQVSDVTDAPEQMAPPAPTPPVQPPAPSAQPATPNVATAPTPQSQTPSVTPISQPTQPAATARAHISVPDRSGFIKKP
jgi:anti-sigma regulatory factor (Ser/Thr protein kinase)